LDDGACLDRALEAFAERGFEGASLREIATACGVSHGLLNARFGSKLGLWTAAVEQGMDRLH
jgi:AcrR family transcriptional regulator